MSNYLKPAEIQAMYSLTREQWNHALRNMGLTAVRLYPLAKPRYRADEILQKFGKPGGEPTKHTENTKGMKR